ncbi:MAG: ATP-binding protein [Bacillota bacterium]|nr:ATP-binding protein [Bacillota bacterium]
MASSITDANSIPEEKFLELSKDYGMDITIFNSNKDISFTTASSESSVFFSKNTNGFSLDGRDNNAYVMMDKKLGSGDSIYYIQLRRPITNYIPILPIAVSIVSALNILIIITSGIKLSRTSRKMLKPIDNMTNTAKSISISALDKRLDVVQSHDELKDLAETFNDMLDRIEKSYEQQNQFVSDASHELRTPIAVIQGYANMLNRWGKDDKAVLEESINAIKSEAENMKELVEKLLFLARADKNTQKIEKDEFPLNGLIDEIMRETRMIDSKHMFLCDRNDEVIIDADRTLIKQALRIFIDNSIKYTPENGLIKLNSINNGSGIILIIQDNGIGIPKEDLPHIFDRFYRCDKARTRQMGGTGLGLSIAKWIIGRHNGNIQVESGLNLGTKIIIYLPYR